MVIDFDRIVNIMSVDVEEYFHPTEVQSYISMPAWERLPSRVERQTMSVLELFERHSVQATFFIVGWVAERHPSLVRAIAGAGHEIGCHSYRHELVFDLSPGEFRRDTRQCMDAIANVTGVLPCAYRAPTYSITRESLWALEILVELGFTHDSSIYPIVHDRYGIPGSPRHAHAIETPAGSIWEVPISTVFLSNRRIAPVGGGAYLRLLPYRYTAAGIRRIHHDEQQPVCLYFHPWELDPDQPRLATGTIARLRTYTGISGMMRKVERLLTDFRFARMSDVHGVKPPSLVGAPG